MSQPPDGNGGAGNEPYDPYRAPPPSSTPPPQLPPQPPPAPAYPQQPYPQQGYPQQTYPQPGYPQQSRRNGLGTAAMVCGIVSIVLCWLGLTLFVAILPFVLGILAVIFGVIGRGRVKRGEATNRGAATSGVITGIVGIVLTIVMIIITVVVLLPLANQIQNCEDAGHSSSYCSEHHGDFPS